MSVEVLLRRHLHLALPLSAALVAATWAVVVGSAHPGKAYSGALVIGLGLAGAARLFSEWTTETDDRARLRDHVRSRLGLAGPPLDLTAEWGDARSPRGDLADDDWIDWLEDPTLDDVIRNEAPVARWVGDVTRESFDWTSWIPAPAVGAAATTVATVDPFGPESGWPAPPWTAVHDGVDQPLRVVR